MSDPLPDFDPFPGEPSLLGLTSKRRLARLLVLLPFCVLATLVLVLSVGQPPHGDAGWQICSDLRTYLKLDHSSTGRCAVPQDTYFPILRDVLSLVAAVTLAVTPILIHRQWTGFATMVSHMSGRGSMRLRDEEGLLAFRREVEAANRDIRRVGRIAPWVMLAMAVVFLVLMAHQSRDGVFYALAPKDGDSHAWALAAYRSWWASPHGNPYGAAVYFAFGTWGVYAITQQNLVGIRIIWALWQSRAVMDFGADPINKDGYFGWKPVREIVAATYIEVGIHGLALICVAATLQPGVLFGPLAAASLQWVLTLPLYLAFPPLFARSKILRYKEAEIESLDEQAASIGPDLPPYQRIAMQDALAARIALVRRIPTLPFKSAKDLALFAATAGANALAILPALIALLVPR